MPTWSSATDTHIEERFAGAATSEASSHCSAYPLCHLSASVVAQLGLNTPAGASRYRLVREGDGSLAACSHRRTPIPGAAGRISTTPQCEKEADNMDHPRPDWSRYRKTLLMSLHRARFAVAEQLTEIRL